MCTFIVLKKKVRSINRMTCLGFSRTFLGLALKSHTLGNPSVLGNRDGWSPKNITTVLQSKT